MENDRNQSSCSGSNRLEEQDEPAVTMLDVLQDEQALEEDANAVLGAADDSRCTYDDGCMKRQALYACTTCSVPASPDFKPAGVCLACSYHCHEGHDLVELYTKRNFRCDCGTSRSGCSCKLRPGKSDNSNSYNQNFSGVYCSCSRPYPDPEDLVVDEMIQCIVCEDWYHGRHLGLESGPPKAKDSSYGELICVGCVKKNPILLNYSGLSVKQMKKGAEESKVDVTSGTEEPILSDKKPSDTEVTKCKLEKNPPKSADNSEISEEASSKSAETLFLPENWRLELCKCKDCSKQYDEQGISFLVDNTDTVHYYESQAKKRKGQFEEGMEALSKMDRIQQVEAISMYNNMKTDLMDYLAKFAQEGKVVKKEDIENFFVEMKSGKRRKLDLPPPDTCK